MIYCILVFFLFVLYCIGSIPTGYWFCKYFFSIDIRNAGSGNIGATNVARVLGSKIYFFYILAFDALKAYCGLMLFSYWFQHSQSILLFSIIGSESLLLLAALAIMLGNSYSLFLSFHGGKGVATMFGIALYILPIWLIGITLIVFALLLAITQRMYVASLSGATTLVIAYIYSCQHAYAHPMMYFLVSAWLLLVYRHRRNIHDGFKIVVR